jgi:hypothetical protein
VTGRRVGRRRWIGAAIAIAWLAPERARGSDHLDTPAMIADPSADIGDLYAWTSVDGRRLNLAMTIVGKRFSDQLLYAFHVDSGPAFGRTTATATIACGFDRAGAAECWAGDADHARGDAGAPAGLAGRAGRFRVFAGERDDPFFNNVKGTRAALGAAIEARRGAPADAAGCPRLDQATAAAIADRWRHSDGGPAVNLLAGWRSMALVIEVELGLVTTGGPMLAVWGGTHRR